MLRLYLYARVRVPCAQLHTRSRVQRAPGLPCALYSPRGTTDDAKLGRKMSREGKAVSICHCDRPDCTGSPARAGNGASCRGIHRLPRTTFCCKNNSMRPLQKRGKVAEQSGVPKMSLFKMQMTGQLPDYFFVTRSDRNDDDLISTYQAGKKSNGKNRNRSVANEIKTRQEKAKRG